jgi:hypothetical protein
MDEKGEGRRLTKMGHERVELRRTGHQRAEDAGSAWTGSSGAPWHSVVAPCWRSSEWRGRSDAADGQGSPRTVSSDAGAVRWRGGDSRHRPSAVRSVGEKEWGSSGIWEENGGGGVCSGWATAGPLPWAGPSAQCQL